MTFVFVQYWFSLLQIILGYIWGGAFLSARPIHYKFYDMERLGYDKYCGKYKYDFFDLNIIRYRIQNTFLNRVDDKVYSRLKLYKIQRNEKKGR